MKKLSDAYRVFAILLLLAAPASAAQVTVTDAWFRALPGKLPAAGYFTIRNTDSRDIGVTGAQSKGCAMLMLHQSSNKGGMTSMAMVSKAMVPAGGTLAFAPNGYHLMCEGANLKIGTKMPVALRFSDGTAQVVNFTVRNAAGK